MEKSIKSEYIKVHVSLEIKNEKFMEKDSISYFNTWSEEKLKRGFDIIYYYFHGKDKLGNLQLEFSTYSLGVCLKVKTIIEEYTKEVVNFKITCDKLVGIFKSHNAGSITSENTLKDVLRLPSYFSCIFKINKKNIEEIVENLERCFKENSILSVNYNFNVIFTQQIWYVGYLKRGEFKDIYVDPVIIYEMRNDFA